MKPSPLETLADFAGAFIAFVLFVLVLVLL